VSKSKTRLVADFLGKVQANTTTGEAEQGDLRNVVGDAPGTLDTLDEIAAAIGDDANFATTVNNALATKLEDITAESIEDLSDVTVPVEGQALGAVPKYTGTGYEISKVTTDEVVEEAGASNLFYTDARAQAAISTDATLSYTNGEVSMPATGVTANTYGSASEVPVLTVDEQGRVTAATTTSVAGVSSFTWDNANNTLNISTADGGSFSADITSISTNVIAALTDSAPGALDTLNELAAAIGDDADFAGTITNALSNKVDKINITGNSFGSANAIPSIIYNDQGQITSASSTAIGGSVTGPFNDLGMQYGVNYSGTPRQGSFFFDSLNQKMMVNTGSAWVDAVPAGTGTSGGESSTTDANATFDQYTFTVSTSTNTVTGTDDAGTTFAYDTNADVVVYVNGVKQLYGASNDYVATNGTSVNFVQNLIAGDVVDVQVYNLLTNDAFYLKTETFTQAETNTQISNAVAGYLPLTGGTLTGNLTTSGSILNTTSDLGITQTSTSHDLLVGSGRNIRISNAGTEWARFTSTRRLGLGSTDPITKLHVRGGSGDATTLTNSSMALGNSSTSGILAAGIDGTGSVPFYSWIQSRGHTDDSNYYNLALNPVAGSVGIGTNNPSSLLHVNGDVLANSFTSVGYSVFKKSGTTAGFGVSNGFTAYTSQTGSTVLDANYVYIYRLTTTGTGTDTGATYLVSYKENSGAWVARAVALNGTSSNNPQLSISGTNVIIWTNHASAYGIGYTVERRFTHESDSTSHFMGEFYNWSRVGNNISYVDGNVGIGTSSPNYHLDVKSGTASVINVGNPTAYGNTGTLGFNNNRSRIVSEVTGGAYGDTDLRFSTYYNNVVSERMGIDEQGRVTMPYQPAFEAWINTLSSSFSQGQTWVFNATRINRGNSFSTSTGRFTAPVEGVYVFGATLGDDDATEFSGKIVSFFVNGGYYRDITEGETGNGAHWETHAGTLIYLNTGDYVDVRCRGGGVILNNGSDGPAFRNSFYGYLLG